MQGGAEFFPRGNDAPITGTETHVVNTNTVNAGAKASAGHMLEKTAVAGNHLLGSAINTGVNLLPAVGVVGLVSYGFQKMYQGLFGSPTQTRTV